ncbi:interleukin-18 receptor accessory protein-like [Bufo gargarizans]|uniref:interleukin-18 receptor accessory protein-like n=1 Tax=Bufo gargarizans TaxID=30331 RepID=UPI001CF446A2|nr:interleukin-18 receptor accessory protein-like [Bufo gargarizans]
MISKVWLNLTLLFCFVRHSSLEKDGVSDCIDEEPRYQYVVFSGETAYFQCNTSSSNPPVKREENIKWFLQKPDRSLEEVKSGKNFNVINGKNKTILEISPLERKHSGTYICRMENHCMKMIVHVKEESCPKYGPKSLFLRNTGAVSVSCPSLNCHQGNNITNVTWYKTTFLEPVESPYRFTLKIINNDVQFSEIYVEDAGIYTCDYAVNMRGEELIMRATIQVSVDVADTQDPPKILGPSNGTEIEAELGKPIELTCRFFFGYERYLNPVRTWTVLKPEFKEERFEGREHCLNISNGLKGYECLITKTLERVTNNDLETIFQCSAQNAVGNVTTTFKLSRRETDVVFLRHTLTASVIFLLILLMCAGAVYVYWIEIVLLYRHYLSKDETIGDNKDFDAFISYATQTTEFSEERSYDNYEEQRFATQLLPSVLEDSYNYKLCIPERDMLPGGAYVEDIAKIVKRSRRAIFILTPRYITGPSLFELQAAITCSLEEQESLKLILIKLEPFKEPESIPHIVKRALRALPIVSWKGDLNSKSAHTAKFWKRIRYYMPVKKSRGNLKL